jgi:hypothetical protein
MEWWQDSGRCHRYSYRVNSRLLVVTCSIAKYIVCPLWPTASYYGDFSDMNTDTISTRPRTRTLANRTLRPLLTRTNLTETDTVAIEAVLKRMPKHLLERIVAAQTRIVVIHANETYAQHSPVLRRLSNGVDNWTIPPAGLYVLEERTVYLRSLSQMSIGHELMHSLDAALGGGGAYLSSVDRRVRSAFDRATAFVTAYSASGIDEYFAESARAMCAFNDDTSFWPKVTPQRLAAIDPPMYAYMSELFAIPTS